MSNFYWRGKLRANQAHDATWPHGVVRVKQDTADKIRRIADRRGITKQAVVDLVCAELWGRE